MYFQLLLAGLLLFSTSMAWGQASSPFSMALLAKYEQHQAELQQSTFGAPILLNAKIGKKQAQGEVYALLDTPFEKLSGLLSQPTHWCDVVILHINIKACTFAGDQVHVYVGRKHYQTPARAFPLQYRFQATADSGDYLSVRLDAPKGPMGTSDYLITLEAIPLDAQRSFIRFQYQYRFGMMARLAMNTYMATLGQGKVGFTVTSTDAEGKPVHVEGLQGVVERNVMRYVIAIQSVLDNGAAANKQLNHVQFDQWYETTLKYPRQLAELNREEYLANKQRELGNQIMMQQDLGKTAIN